MLKVLHKSKLIRVLFMIAFFISGIIINLIQFLLYLTIRFKDIALYRRLNYYLIYTQWSQIVAISEWWSGSKVRLFFADQRSIESHATAHTLYVMNHRYELDWLWAWMVLDKYSVLGMAKSIAKKSLRWLPIIGWGWVLDEFIFLERDAKKDLVAFPKGLDRLMAYDPPMCLLLFSEGTRFTESKYENSLEFAEKRGLPKLKYHLLPRTKGFALIVKHFKEKYPDTVLYDIQLRFQDNSNPPTFMSLVKGKQLIGDFHLRVIPISEVPTDSEQQISDFLYDLYEKKDKLMDFHVSNGKFPGILVEKPRRLAPLVNWMSWFVIVLISLVYILYKVFASGNLVLISITTLIFAIALGSVYIMIGASKIKKGSKYGTKSKDNPNNNDNKSPKPTKRLNLNEENANND